MDGNECYLCGRRHRTNTGEWRDWVLYYSDEDVQGYICGHCANNGAVERYKQSRLEDEE